MSKPKLGDLGPVGLAAHDMHKHVVELHGAITALLYRVAPKIEKNALTEAELTDFGYYCREMELILDELRKECAARKILLGKILARKATLRSLEDPSIPPVCHGAVANASADVVTRAVLPKKGEEGYAELLRAFGVNEEAVKFGVLAPHFTHLTEYLTALQQEGRRPPPGIPRTYQDPNVKFRRRQK